MRSNYRAGVGRALVRISRAAAKRRWTFVLVWVALVVLALPFAGRAQSKLSNGGFEVPGAESQRNLAYFEHLPRYGAQPFTLLVSASTPDAAAARLAVVQREALAVDGRIRFTTAPTSSADGRTRAVTGYASVSQNEALSISRRLADRFQVTDGSMRVYVLGAPALYASFQRIIESDLARAETLTAPFIAIVLIALFGALVAATLPLALARRLGHHHVWGGLLRRVGDRDLGLRDDDGLDDRDRRRRRLLDVRACPVPRGARGRGLAR